jgi:uncharacterized protein (DUF58 family)
MLLKELQALLYEFEVKYKKKPISPRIGQNKLNRIGRGMDYKESRIYSYGDDVRFIDWNISSRMNDLYVKIYHEESDREIIIFLDVSASMNFKASNNRTKFFIAYQILCFISLITIQSGDRVNLVLYSDKIEFKKTGLRTKVQCYSAFKQIQNYKTNSKTNHLLPLEYLKNSLKKNSIAYIISDFANLNDLSQYKPILNLHEVYSIRIFDPIEEASLSKILKSFSITNLESGTEGYYSSSFKQDELKLKNFNKMNIFSFRTNSNLAKEVVRFFGK